MRDGKEWSMIVIPVMRRRSRRRFDSARLHSEHCMHCMLRATRMSQNASIACITPGTVWVPGVLVFPHFRCRPERLIHEWFWTADFPDSAETRVCGSWLTKRRKPPSESKCACFGYTCEHHHMPASSACVSVAYPLSLEA